jgi:pyridoxamine 5'-phosphate oxidase-like protein
MTTKTEAIPAIATGTGPALTTDDVWRAIEKATFAVVSYDTPTGEPRSSGVMIRVTGRKVYVAVGADSWKARHIALHGRVAVTVTVRRGGLLSLVAPIPPATISFHGDAEVHTPGSPEIQEVLEAMGSLLPPDRRETAAVLEIMPDGMFSVFGIGVPLIRMREPELARARVPVR